MVYVTKSPLFTYWDPADFEMVIVPRAVGRGVAVPVITGDAVSVRVTVDVVVNVYVNVGVAVNVGVSASADEAAVNIITAKKSTSAEILIFFIFLSFYFLALTMTETAKKSSNYLF
jgi:hypothetical protein